MDEHRPSPNTPDLTRGVPVASLADGEMLVGHVGDESVLLTHTGDDFFATGATCTHYGALLADGLIMGDTVRCPWHHARFDLRTGEARCAPALNPLTCWEVKRHNEMVYVTGKREVTASSPHMSGAMTRRRQPESIAIVGAGAAGNAAAETLRRLGYDGRITMIGAETSLPYDRPNLSKDYLAGKAPDEWIPLRTRKFYDDHAITLLSGVTVGRVDGSARRLTLDYGPPVTFDRLLLATGADPVRLDVVSADRAPVHYLRSLKDCGAIIAAAARARHVVVIGASFIGLEVAASLRMRGLEVHVVGRGRYPLERTFGPEVGTTIRALHEAQGVVFHLGATVAAIGKDTVLLEGGAVIPADLVVIGIGVKPNVALAKNAGLTVDRGIAVSEYLETSLPRVFAAGDVARWPDPRTGERIRVEHWVVAERQGQVAAHNMLASRDGSDRERFDAVPFFWTQHYDMSIRYVGHAERWDEVTIDGDLAAKDATVSYSAGGRLLAVATVGRDRDSLRAEAVMEQGVWSAPDALVRA